MKRCSRCQSNKAITEFKLNSRTQHLSAYCIPCQTKEAERKRKQRKEEEEQAIDDDEESTIETPPMSLDEFVELIHAWGSRAHLEFAARINCADYLANLGSTAGKIKAKAVAEYLGSEMGLLWW